MWTKENITDQAGKTVVVTGGNSGIGFETAKALYENGALVILACRDLGKAQSAVEQIMGSTGSGKVSAALLDLSSLRSVETFAESFKQEHRALHLLINNAGIMTPPQAFTADGYELQFGVNFLGHFALTAHLYPLIRKSEAARIVTVTSLAYTYGHIDFENLKSEQSYDAFREYCQSKLADLLFTVELQRRITAQGDQVLSLASHPGVTKSELSRHMSADEITSAIERLGALMETANGALPSLYAAVSPEVKEGGFYGPNEDGGLRGYPVAATIQENALDKTVALKLWKMAEKATGCILQ